MLNKYIKQRFIRVLIRLFLGTCLFIFFLILAIRLPVVQNFIIGKVTNYISGKTQTEVRVEKLYLTFDGSLSMQGLYLEDQDQDTLIYSRSLEASIGLIPLIRGESITIKSITWQGLVARVIKAQEDSTFNYEFLIDAFVQEPDAEQASETPESSMKVNVGRIDFADFDIRFLDHDAGINSSLHLGSFSLGVKSLDLEQMDFQLRALTISDSRVKFHQLEPSSMQPIAPDTAASDSYSLPTLSIDQLALNNILIDYQSVPDQIKSITEVGIMRIDAPLIQMGQRKIEIDKFTFNDSKLLFQQSATPGNMPKDTVELVSPAFEWPDWQVKINKINIEENQLELHLSDSVVVSGAFQPDHLNVQHLNFITGPVLIVPGQARLRLDEFSFLEQNSGLELNKMGFQLSISEKSSRLDNLQVATKTSGINGALYLDYPSIEALLDNPDLAHFKLNLDQFELGLKEAYLFDPLLATNEYLAALSEKPITGAMQVQGAMDTVEFPDIRLNWGEQNQIRLQGKITNPTDMELLNLRLDTLSFTAKSAELTPLIKELADYELPKRIDLNGRFAGGLNGADLHLQMLSAMGNISIEGQLNRQNDYQLAALLKTEDLNLAKLLQNEMLGPLSLEVRMEGQGTALEDLNGKIETNFSALTLNGYDFSNLKLEGAVQDGQAILDLGFKDENLDFLLKTTAAPDSMNYNVHANLELIGADFLALGLSANDIRAAFKLETDFEGNDADFAFKTLISEAVVIKERQPHYLGDVDIRVNSAKDTLRASIESNLADVMLAANRQAEETLPILEKWFYGYLYQENKPDLDDTLNDAHITLDLVARQRPILNEVFLTGLEKMDSVSFHLQLDEQQNLLEADLHIPYIQYQGNVLDSLRFGLKGSQNSLDLMAGWSGINAGAVVMDKMELIAGLDKGEVNSQLTIFDDQQPLMSLASLVKLKGDTIQWHINPEGLIINKKPWQIPVTNQLQYADQYIAVRDFRFQNASQTLTLTTSRPELEVPHVGIEFDDFKLSTIAGILNPEKLWASGTTKGNLIAVNPFGSYGLLAELQISDLKALEADMGNLTLRATSKGAEKYDLKLDIAGEDVKLDLQGNYLATDTAAQLGLDLNLAYLSATVVEQAMKDYVSEAKGSLSATVNVSGSLNNPQYEGTLKFAQAGFKVDQLNSSLLMNQEEVKINNSGLYLDDFIIIDADNNSFALDGEILTPTFENPVFDLKLKSRQFGLINSTKKNNDLFYGQIKLDADLAITGNLDIPKVRGKLKVTDGSTLTFKVPESQVELKSREGVVLFVNRENPEDILTRVGQTESSLNVNRLSGYDIETQLTIGENVQFDVIIDEQTGDHLQASGQGDFTLSLAPNGYTSLSGKYELSGGYFETNLYNLVKRRFDIAPGSSISWSGDPYEADLNVKAIYNVNTAAAPLMAIRTSSQESVIESSYQQSLPFQVFIKVDGALLQPDLSFELDMPEEERGVLQGSVYREVQQLNGQKEELNKQVFSLLVLNRFFPSSGSDGSNGGPASLALDNVNKVLSGQLNNYSDKLLGGTGIDLGFDLKNNTNTTDNTNQTQLGITAKKQLFNDRLIIQVGSDVDVAGGKSSAQGTPIIGNVSVEYLLTQDKRLRLQGFSRNQFEGFIDGQLTVSGIALIFTREFNKFKELWTRQVKEEVAKKSKKD